MRNSNSIGPQSITSPNPGSASKSGRFPSPSKTVRGGSPLFHSSTSMQQSSLPLATMWQVEGSCIFIRRCCQKRPRESEISRLHDSRVQPNGQCSRPVEPQPNTSSGGGSSATSDKELSNRHCFRRLQGCEGYGRSQDPPSSCMPTSA